MWFFFSPINWIKCRWEFFIDLINIYQISNKIILYYVFMFKWFTLKLHQSGEEKIPINILGFIDFGFLFVFSCCCCCCCRHFHVLFSIDFPRKSADCCVSQDFPFTIFPSYQRRCCCCCCCTSKICWLCAHAPLPSITYNAEEADINIMIDYVSIAY